MQIFLFGEIFAERLRFAGGALGNGIKFCCGRIG
jgi:hypothetical protein